MDEFLVLHVSLVILIDVDRPPECLQWHDILLSCLLVILASSQLLFVEVVIRHIEVVRHDLSEGLK